ncbi:MAG TPA: hypothetical protein VLT16_01840, partial [Candidatus Limnocylindrales bacterium]|nr:hypothetical protein [Candidatus Limnocylindrales bacterium]
EAAGAAPAAAPAAGADTAGLAVCVSFPWVERPQFEQKTELSGKEAPQLAQNMKVSPLSD